MKKQTDISEMEGNFSYLFAEALHQKYLYDIDQMTMMLVGFASPVLKQTNRLFTVQRSFDGERKYLPTRAKLQPVISNTYRRKLERGHLVTYLLEYCRGGETMFTTTVFLLQAVLLFLTVGSKESFVVFVLFLITKQQLPVLGILC